ncbi:phospholipase D family protein [Flavobacterium sp.]|uniref:phospholipase D family protein n=1 Tax=Flavobacterium sp. TaxID=239 RepID=UPI004047EE66
MNKFITGENLENAVYEIIWEAKKNLIIVSPFIKLDDYFKRLFNNHINNPKLHILIVFGKNENKKNKSLSNEDFNYFKKFLNISIVYVPNLHAKYYGNEKKGVITSINLYDYSFKNNIEFGVYSELNLLSKYRKNADNDAWQTCYNLAEKSEAIFIKRPVYEKKILSPILGKNYVKSDILHDITSIFFSSFDSIKQYQIKTLNDFDSELDLGSMTKLRPYREVIEIQTIGYCIRTGDKIAYNPNKPYSNKSYRSWASFRNENYPENFCHKTGKRSNGKTSMKKPIL